MRSLLDTNICSYLIRHKPAIVVERFRGCSLNGIGISTITLFELQYGMEKSQYRDKSREALHHFLFPLRIVDVDRQAAEKKRQAFEPNWRSEGHLSDHTIC